MHSLLTAKCCLLCIYWHTLPPLLMW